MNAVREERGQSDVRISGLGDIEVSTLWNPFNDSEHRLNGLKFLGGFTLPTGDESDQAPVGIANPEVFQLGTGAFQINLGLIYTKSIGDWNYRWDFNLSTPLEESDQGFRPASVYSAGFNAGRSLTDKLGLQLGLDVTYADDDEFRGNEITSSFTRLDLETSLNWQVTPAMSVSTSVAIPVYQDVKGVQLGAGPVLSVEWGYNF